MVAHEGIGDWIAQEVVRVAERDQLGLLEQPKHAKRLYPGLNTTDASYWMGHRPSLPDSLPVIGRAPRHANAYLAFGHGHIGLTTAAITGRAIADRVAGRPPPFDLEPFRADRF
ncbi:MAG: NAD(P)/FAD-dependent oxidoreductase [Geminicoccaceae bacterium]